MPAQTELVLQTVVKGTETATKALNDIKGSLDGINQSAKATTKTTNSFTQKLDDNKEGFKALGIAAGVATYAITSGIKGSLEEAKNFQNAFIGLKSVVDGTGQSYNKAEEFIKSFTKDGLVSSTAAATSLKNLLSGGFGLDRSIEIMNRFKDSAAFGRQGMLSMSQAIQGATDGLKNTNSVLVDNVGVTTNLSVMWQEYAASIGTTEGKLTTAQKREAEYQGILKATTFQLGDAKKFSDGYGGALARQDAASLKLQQTIGTALMPAMTKITEAITGILSPIASWSAENPKITATLILVTTTIVALTAGIVALGFAIPPITAGITALGVVFGAITLPIGLVIGAIVGVGVAFYELYANWSSIQPMLSNIWDTILLNITYVWVGIKSVISSGLNFVKTLWTTTWEGLKIAFTTIWTAIGLIIGLSFQLLTGDFKGFMNNLVAIWNTSWNTIKTALVVTGSTLKNVSSSIWDSITTTASIMWTTLKDSIINIVLSLAGWFSKDGLTAITNGFTTMFSSIGNIAINIFDGIKNTVSGFLDQIISMANSAISYANKVPGVSIGNIPTISGARATGGPVSGGSSYLVGERGPEIFTPGSSGQIIPNNKIGGGGNIVINFTGTFGQNVAEEIGDMVVRQLSRASFI